MTRSIIIGAMLAVASSTAAAQNLVGTVTVDGVPRQGAVVSDGVNVVTTDKNGHYKMNTRGRQHVFVSVPSDCAIPLDNGRPAFFRTIDFSAGEPVTADFALTATDSNKNWTLLALADVQIGFQKDYEDLKNDVMPMFVDSLKNFDGAVYGISLGDIVWNKPDFYDEYLEQIDRMNLPVFSVIGNHDHNEKTMGDIYSDMEFRDNLGPTYYSVNIGDCHLVALDNIIYDGAKGRSYYECNLTREQLDWLKKDLKHVDKDKTIIIGMHAPSIRRYNGGSKMKTTDELYDLVKDFNDVQILTGHMHNNFYTKVADNITDTTFGAVNGAFWYPICNDGSPQGYGVLRFEGNKLVDKYYRGFREPRSYQIKMYAPAEAVLWQPEAKPGDPYDKILINIWGWGDGWTVEARHDGGAWTTLDPDKDRTGLPARDPGVAMQATSKKGTLKANHGGSRPSLHNDHLFLYRPADDWKTAETRATDPFGNVYTAILTNDKH